MLTRLAKRLRSVSILRALGFELASFGGGETDEKWALAWQVAALQHLVRLLDRPPICHQDTSSHQAS